MKFFGFSRRIDPSVGAPTHLLGAAAGVTQSAAPVGAKGLERFKKDLGRQWGFHLFSRIGSRDRIRQAHGDPSRYVMFRKGDPSAIRLELVGKLHSVRSGGAGALSDSAAKLPDASSKPPAPSADASELNPPSPADASSIESGAPAPGAGEAVPQPGPIGDQPIVAENIPPPETQLSDRIRERSTQADLQGVRVADLVDDLRSLSSPEITQALPADELAALRRQVVLQLVELKCPESTWAFYSDATLRFDADYFADIDRPIEEREQKLLEMGGRLDTLGSVDTQYSDPDLQAAARLVGRERALAAGVARLEARYQSAPPGGQSDPNAVTQPDAFLDEFGGALSQLAGRAGAGGSELIERLLDQARVISSRVDPKTKTRTEVNAGDMLHSARAMVGILVDPGYASLTSPSSRSIDAAISDSMRQLEGFAQSIEQLVGDDGHLDHTRLNLLKAAAGSDAERQYVEARHELHKSVRDLRRLFQGLGTTEGDRAKFTPFFAGARVRLDGDFMSLIKGQPDLVKSMPEVNLLLAHVMLLQVRAERLKRGLDPDLDTRLAGSGLASVFTDQDLSALGFSADAVSALRAGNDSAFTNIQGRELAQSVRQLVGTGLRRGGDVNRINDTLKQTKAKLLGHALARQDLGGLLGNAARAEAIIALTGADAAIRAGRLMQMSTRPVDADQRQAWHLAAGRISATYDQLSALSARLAQAKDGIAALEKGALALALKPAQAATAQCANGLVELRSQRDALEAMTALEAKLNDPNLSPEESDQLEPDRQACREQIEALKASAQSQIEALRRLTGSPLHARLFPSGQPGDFDALIARSEVPLDPEQPDSPSLAAVADWVQTLNTAPGQEKVLRDALREDTKLHSDLIRGRDRELSTEQKRDLRMAFANAAARCLTESRHADLPAGDETPAVLWNQRDRFLELVKEAGVDTDRFAVEIEDMLVRELTAETLQSWVKEASKAQIPSAKAHRNFQDATSALIAGQVPTMKSGDRMFLKANGSIEVGLNRIPIPITGSKVDVAASSGKRDIMVIQRKAESLSIAIRSGVTGGLRLGASQDLVGPLVKATAKAQLTRSSVAGYAIEIPMKEGPDQLKAVQQFLNRLLGDEPITAQDLALAKDIRAISKFELKASFDASLTAGYMPPATSNAYAKPMLGASLGGSSAVARAGATQENNKVAVFKKAKSYTTQFTGTAGLNVRTANLASLGAAQVLPTGSVLEGSFRPGMAPLVGAQASLSKSYEAELSVQTIPQDGSAVKAEFEYAIPLASGLTRADLESMDPNLATQLSRLDDTQRAQFDSMLSKVDTPDGYLLLASSECDKSRLQDLNAQYAKERAQAQANRALGTSVARQQLELAEQNHRARLEKLEDDAGEFKLQRLILVKGDMMARGRAVNLGVVRVNQQGQSGAGTTVELLDLTKPPAG